MQNIMEPEGNSKSELLRQSIEYIVRGNKCSNDIKIRISKREYWKKIQS